MGLQGEHKQVRTLGVYIHFPYCTGKCVYCDFASVPSTDFPEKRFVSAVKAELRSILSHPVPTLTTGPAPTNPATTEDLTGRWRSIESIYIGGGTPSLLSPEAVGEITRSVFDTLAVAPGKGEAAPEITPEITIEANPEALTVEKLRAFKEAGINRLSLGVQSTDDRLLRSIGRRHTSREATDAIDAAREAGFTNLSVDLIFGLPGQTVEEWAECLAEVTLKRPDHLSVYGLTVEKGTPLERSVSLGQTTLPTDDETLTMYQLAMTLLKNAGYTHYEISNFALPGKESRHNSRYWQGGDYLGVGPAAHSYIAGDGGSNWGRRWWNEKDPARYMKIVADGGFARAGFEALAREEALTEAILCGMRMMEGIDARSFKERYGAAPEDAMDYARLEELGFVERVAGTVRLTAKGILFSNEVF